MTTHLQQLLDQFKSDYADWQAIKDSELRTPEHRAIYLLWGSSLNALHQAISASVDSGKTVVLKSPGNEDCLVRLVGVVVNDSMLLYDSDRSAKFLRDGIRLSAVVKIEEVEE